MRNHPVASPFITWTTNQFPLGDVMLRTLDAAAAQSPAKP